MHSRCIPITPERVVRADGSCVSYTRALSMSTADTANKALHNGGAQGHWHVAQGVVGLINHESIGMTAALPGLHRPTLRRRLKATNSRQPPT